MPFTPTHILAILPFIFLRRWLPVSAMVIGAVVPDTPLFFPILDYAQTHSLFGVLSDCLPLGVSLFLLFQCVLKQPMFALLPRWIQVRLEIDSKPLLVPKVSFFAGVAAAVLIGAYSHVLWDSFSHQGKWGTHFIPALNDTFSIGAWSLRGYKLVQYGSTLVGLPLFALVAGIMLARTEPSDRTAGPNVTPRIKALAVATCLAVPMIAWICAWRTGSTPYQILGTTITSSGAVLMVGLLAYSLLFQAFRSRTSIR